MRRRDFIAAIGGGTLWPLTVRAQRADRIRRVVVLVSGTLESDPASRSSVDGFIQELARLGWVVGRNIRIDQKWPVIDIFEIQRAAKELADLRPDAILAIGTPAVAALQRETRTIPIVFTLVADPVGDGFVAGLPRPGGNITGFIYAEAAMAGKWLQLVKEIAPGIKRAAAMYDPDSATYAQYYLASFEAAAQTLEVEPIVAPVHSDGEAETIIDALGRGQGALLLIPDAFTVNHRAALIAAANRNKVPTIATQALWARTGGLLSYGPDGLDFHVRAAGYVDRILRGTKPADLPVQAPVKYETVLNMKTAKALGIEVPTATLLRADEVIE
jgi:putative tryptophan/tyrosine transport system substrate-binding protein